MAQICGEPDAIEKEVLRWVNPTDPSRDRPGIQRCHGGPEAAVVKRWRRSRAFRGGDRLDRSGRDKAEKSAGPACRDNSLNL